HDALRTLLLNDALVIRKIERSRLHAAVALAGTEYFVDDANGRGRAELRISITRVNREIVFQLLQMPAEFPELRRLGVVAQRYVRFKRGFVIEQLVFVSLVWSNRDVDRRVEVHPRDVAFVVVV